MALRLKRQGISRVRPVLGGLELWIERKFSTIVLKLGSGEPSRESPARS
jgi:hypothetical protein